MILPIIGGRHRPPANGILAIIPIGQDLEVVPEPDNEFTTEEFPNAIAVWVEGSAIKAQFSDEAESIIQGYGYSTEDITAEGYWHLGYIPKEIAKDINLPGPVRGRYCVGGDGGHRVEFDPQSPTLR